MGTIKLKRGTGTPAGSIEQYEVAMDVAAKNLYTSTDGSDAVILADNTENFLGTNTTELDVTSDLDLNNNEIKGLDKVEFDDSSTNNEITYNGNQGSAFNFQSLKISSKFNPSLTPDLSGSNGTFQISNYKDSANSFLNRLELQTEARKAFFGVFVTDTGGGDDGSHKTTFTLKGADSASHYNQLQSFTSAASTPAATRLDITGSAVSFFDDEYRLPTTDGSADQFLKTDGSGNISFSTELSGLTNNANNYGTVITAKRDGADTIPGGVTTLVVQRDIGTETLSGNFDSRGPSVDFNLVSDDGNLTQYQGGIQFQSNNDDGTDPEAWFRAYSYDGSAQDNIIQANKNDCYISGNLRAQNELIVTGVSEFNDTVTVDATAELKGEVQLHESTSKLSIDGAEAFQVYDTDSAFIATNYNNLLKIEREETNSGQQRISGYTQVNYVDGNRDLIDPGDGSGAAFAFGINRSQFAQIMGVLETAAINTDNTVDYVNSESRIQFGVWTGDPTGTGAVTLTTALMIEPHINQITMNSIDGGVTNFGTDGDGLGFQAKNLTFNLEADGGTFNDIDFNVGGNNKLVVVEHELRADVPFRLPSHTVANLPTSNISAGAMAFCTNETGGSVPVFWDGSNWRRTTDRAVAS